VAAAAPATLSHALSSDDAEERRQATAELGGVALDAALPLLVRALGDEDWRVRKEATVAARAFGPAPALIDALVGALDDADNVGLRNAAVDVLSSAGQAATPALAAALGRRDGRLDADARKLVVETLGKGRDPAALGVVAAALGDPDENVRQGAMEAVAGLGALDLPRAEALLLGRLDDRDRIVRLTALTGLTGLGVAIPWARLAPLLADPTLRSAALAAASLGDDPEAARALASALAGARGAAFDQALQGLGRLAEGPCAASVAEAIRAAGPELGRRLVAAAAPDSADAGDGDDDTASRRATALLLAAAAGVAVAPGVVAAAVAALAEEQLADAAQRALAALGAPALPEMVARLGDASVPAEGRAALVDAVGEVMAGGGAAALLAEPLAALRRAARDPERQVAVRALSALSRLGEAKDLDLCADLVLAEARPLAAAAEGALAALAARFPAAARAFVDSSDGDEARILAAAIALGAVVSAADFGERDATFLAHAAIMGDPRARRAAVHAVSEVRAAGAPFPAAMEVLRLALTDEEHEVRVAAARALGRLCTAKDAPHASDVLDLVDRSGQADLVATTVRAIGEGLRLAREAGRAAAPDDLVPALGLFARGAPSPVAMAAVEALGQAERAGAPSAVEALAAALDHADVAVVKAALLKLAASAGGAEGASGPAAQAALRALERGLDHPDAAVRVLAAEMLAEGREGGR
jgi:HEAT repeat protein